MEPPTNRRTDRRTPEDVACPTCKVPAGAACVRVASGQVLGHCHWARQYSV